MRLGTEYLDSVADAVDTQAVDLTNPPMTTSELLDGLEQVGLVRTVAQLRSDIS